MRKRKAWRAVTAQSQLEPWVVIAFVADWGFVVRAELRGTRRDRRRSWSEVGGAMVVVCIKWY